MSNIVEMVFSGHPDKIADQLSDSLVDVAVSNNKNAKCAFECMISSNYVFVGGESSENITLDDISFAFKNIMDYAGYGSEKYLSAFNFIKDINRQSSYINNNRGNGAGDQGVVWGMASSESKRYLPYLLNNSHELLRDIDLINSKENTEYQRNGKLLVDQDRKFITVSLAGDYNQSFMHLNIKDAIEKRFAMDYELSLNPPGLSPWEGSPKYDTGLTGRKLICDAYGSFLKHGGGAWSGKDMTKLDRSGSYLARELSVEILNKYSLDNIEISLTYEMGSQKPIGVHFNINGGTVGVEKDIKNDIDKFFEKEKFSETVDRYLSTTEKYSSLSDPLIGHIYNAAYEWNRYKKIL